MVAGFIGAGCRTDNHSRQSSIGTMKIIARQKGNRRWDLPREFPLVDSQGLLVMCDRRKLADRRKNISDLDGLMAILSKLTAGTS
jgi:hypothetical protein